MSRTDKDRPYRVKLSDETLGSYIDHDHTRGYCEVAPANTSWHDIVNSRNHNCNKVLRGVLYCAKKSTLKVGQRLGGPGWWIYNSRDCWRSYRAWEGDPYTSDSYWVSTQCEGHLVVDRDTSIPCVCDEWGPYPRCDRELPEQNAVRYYRRGGAPKWFNDHVWQNPERVRERDELKKAAALYNAGDWDDEFDFDFPNYQHRRNASWYYW